MNAQPTTDPAVSMALSRAIDEVASNAEGCLHCIVSKQTPQRPAKPVTRQMFQALKGLTARLGYTLRIDDILHSWSENTILEGITHGWPQLTVTLDESLDPQRAFSVHAHELSHIILGHNPRNSREMEKRYLAKLGQTPGAQEEVPCDLAAGAIMKVAGLSDGQENADYIRGEMRGRPIPQHLKDAANLAARVLWAALNEEGTAYAYAA